MYKMKILSSIFENITNKSKITVIRTIYHRQKTAKVSLIKWKKHFGVKINLPNQSYILHIDEIILLTLFSLKCIDYKEDNDKIISRNLSVKILSSIAIFYYFDLPLFQCSRNQLKFVLYATKSSYKNDMLKNSTTFLNMEKPLYFCNQIIINLTKMHQILDNAKIVFERWKNICNSKCNLVSYNSDCAAEINLYKICNKACISFDTKSIIVLFNLSLINFFQQKEEQSFSKEFQEMHILQRYLLNI